MESQAGMLTVLREGIEALARADAARLIELAHVAGEVQVPETQQDRAEALRLHRTLGDLLVLTGRNLRLLGIARGSADRGVRVSTGCARWRSAGRRG